MAEESVSRILTHAKHLHHLLQLLIVLASEELAYLLYCLVSLVDIRGTESEEGADISLLDKIGLRETAVDGTVLVVESHQLVIGVGKLTVYGSDFGVSRLHLTVLHEGIDEEKKKHKEHAAYDGKRDGDDALLVVNLVQVTGVDVLKIVNGPVAYLATETGLRHIGILDVCLRTLHVALLLQYTADVIDGYTVIRGILDIADRSSEAQWP